MRWGNDSLDGVWENYSALFSKVLAADAPIAHRAIQLRAATPQRLPTVDALIAATAAEHDLILVHRDPHLSAIPTASLQQMRLPKIVILHSLWRTGMV